MAQLVARLSGGQEAVSSSLATPTKYVVTVSCHVFFIGKEYENKKKEKS